MHLIISTGLRRLRTDVQFLFDDTITLDSEMNFFVCLTGILDAYGFLDAYRIKKKFNTPLSSYRHNKS